MFRSPESFPSQTETLRQDGFKQEREPWSEKSKLGDLDAEIIYSGAEKRKNAKSFNNIETDVNVCEVSEIRFINSEGKVLEFSSLLPPEWKFATEGPYATNSISNAETTEKIISFPGYVLDPDRTKITQVPENQDLPQPHDDSRRKFFVSPIDRRVAEIPATPILEKPTAILGILHEIGHIEKGISQEEFYLHQKLEEKETLRPKEREIYGEIVIRHERDAWAYALKQYRDLKKQGFDLYPQAENNQEILDFVDKCLDTYMKKLEIQDSPRIKRGVMDFIKNLFQD